MNKYFLATIVFFLTITPSFSYAATLYFNGATNNDWNELTNWWTNSGHSNPASAIPTASDDAIVSATVSSNSGPAISIGALTVNGSGYLGVDLTATGGAIFNDNSYHYIGTLTASTTFHSNSHNHSPVVGNTWFNTDSFNEGTVSGNGTFSGASQNQTTGVISGNATFAGTSRNYNGGTVSGDATFNGTGVNSGTIGGNATFNGGQNSGTVSGNATFNSVNNASVVSGDATFNGTSINNGGVSGDATFNNTSYNHNGIISGDAYFYDTTRNNNDVLGDAYFYENSYNNLGDVSGNGYFFNQSYNAAEIRGDARFLDTTYNDEIIYGDACFVPTASNRDTVFGTISVCDETSPLISSITADENRVVITYDELLDSGSVPSTGDFIVLVDGSSATVSSVGISGFSVTLTLSNAISYNQSVTVSYTVPVSNMIQDSVGNDASAISPASNATNLTEEEPDNSRNSRRSGGGGGGSSNRRESSINNSQEGTSDQQNIGTNRIEDSFSNSESFGDLKKVSFRDLTLGSVGIDVLALQRFLNENGFLVAVSGNGSPSFETEYFGPLTRSALARWQSANGVFPALGYYGPITRAKIGI